MNRSPAVTALLDLPAVAGQSTLRAALMALNVPPVVLPTESRGRSRALEGLAANPNAVAFIDVSRRPAPGACTLLELDASVPRDATRARIFLTRLAGGHVSPGDRRWVRALGFADLLMDFDTNDCEGQLRNATDGAARVLALTPLPKAELARYARAMNSDPDTQSPRAIIRALAGSSAEDFAALLHRSLTIVDRTYRLKTYPKCFVGSEAASWIARNLKRSNTDAVLLGQALTALGLLVHVVQEQPFQDANFFYRLAWSPAVDELHLGALFEALRGGGGVSIGDRLYLGKTYPRCWVGSEAVSWLGERHALSRTDAWLVLHRLMQFGLIDHVTNERPMIDGAFFYRFTSVAPARGS